MDIDEKQILITRDLLMNTVKLREKIENYERDDAYKKSYIKILRDIEKFLSDQPVDFVKLGKAEFGIFRLVKDGPGDDPIAQELLSLLEKIYFFRKNN